MQTEGRMVWLDALRLTAGLSMVALHATADPAGQPWVDYPAADRVLPLLLRAVLYVARTELFIIISIFLLLISLERRPRGYGATIWQQAERLLAPFLFWCLFFAGYNLLKATAFGYPDAILAELASPQAWLGYVMLGSVKYHMHFIPTLFGILLAYPLYRIAVRMPALGFGVFVCLAARQEIDAMLYAHLWGNDLLPFALRAIKILTYVGYGLVAAAFVGLMGRASRGELGPVFPIIAYAGVLLFAVKLVATWRTIDTGAWPVDYRPGVWVDALMPALLFVGAMALAHRHWPPILCRLAPYSFGLYLCHPIFLDLTEIALRHSLLAPIWQVLIKITVAVAATSCLLIVLKQTRALAWTVGLGPLPRFSHSFLPNRKTE